MSWLWGSATQHQTAISEPDTRNPLSTLHQQEIKIFRENIDSSTLSNSALTVLHNVRLHTYTHTYRQSVVSNVRIPPPVCKCPSEFHLIVVTHWLHNAIRVWACSVQECIYHGEHWRMFSKLFVFVAGAETMQCLPSLTLERSRYSRSGSAVILWQ